ncbi:MAG TPA: AAA family ATPase [Archangium sp.]|uniref:nSTAND1 domain-containing NTPase n=1 Tax=Archangium sp. TaxID=1872627 RepID=UPI002E324502|nr:AAA family ATPase [Archangium sp.]HEX5744774.1 AAA family ATPase [Archangium sp.]
MSGNPFLGPQPYRSGDRHRFFGRNEVTQQLANRILAHPCVTLFGPSGAGKSSLMQAGVLPLLEATHDTRVVHIEGWLKDEAPLERLVQAMFRQLDLGLSPAHPSPSQGLEAALELAEQQSARPLLICLDQLEQLFQQGRDARHLEEFLESLQALARSPLRGLQLVLSLREDYLGRFRDQARGRRELLAQGFRLGPLTVGEMVKVACQLAEAGTPAQQWSGEELSELMFQVRMVGQDRSEEAEVQAAFAQIVCRALWEERAKGGATEVARAELMLHQYLETTLDGMGELKGHAQRLLEDHLVAGDKSRTLLTEKQAHAVLSELSEAEASTVLTRLEAAAVLHAEEHQGSRYFELGHDWLARKVFERREERVRQEQEARRLQEERTRQEEETRKLREEQEQQAREAARKLREELAARRRLALLAGGAVMVAVLMGLLLFWALRQRSAAEVATARARDHALMAGAREQLGRSSPAIASRLLLEVKNPEQVRGWMQVAIDLLKVPIPTFTLHCHEGARDALFSPDGSRIAVMCGNDRTVRVWKTDGSGEPVVLRGHEASVWSAAFSPDGQRIVTASLDKTARVWKADGSGEPVVLRGHEASVLSAAFSPDGQRIVTASEDNTARVWKADGSGEPVVLRGHENSVWSAAFSPDGQRIVTASSDKTARVWKADGSGEPVVLRGHEDSVLSAAFSPDGQRIVTASWDKTARVWKADGSGEPVVLRGHEASVSSAAFSPDGQRIVTASEDSTARVWPGSISELQRLLREVNTDCLSPQARQTYLDESEPQAQERYERCERSYGRSPFFTAAPQTQSAAP